MASIGPYLVGVAFWVFIGAVAVAGIVTDYKRRRGGVVRFIAEVSLVPADMVVSPWGWAVSMLIGAWVIMRTRPSRR